MTDDSIEDEFSDADADEFLSFVSKLADRNRQLQIRREIERREESIRLSDSLGLDSFELEESY